MRQPRPVSDFQAAVRCLPGCVTGGRIVNGGAFGPEKKGAMLPFCLQA